MADISLSRILSGMVMMAKVPFNPGNNRKYDIEQMEVLQDSPLKGKTLIFLGSSVTVGACSQKQSFPLMLEHCDGAKVVLEAVSGTTLVDKTFTVAGKSSDSYITRMKRIDKSLKADAFICQLSTNDASSGFPLGKMTEGFEKESFDTQTIIGAMEYVIAYARETWHCSVLFYTGPKYESALYEQMVAALLALSMKWGIHVIDLWNNEEIERNYRGSEYMHDPIHPTKKGYQIWTPIFRKEIAAQLKSPQEEENSPA